jgi:mono/diheme cytochrome c family protein
MRLIGRHHRAPTLVVPFVLLLVALGMVSAGDSAEPQKLGRSTGDPAKGKKLFAVKCVACHKADGSGGVKVTTVATPDFRDSTRMADPKHDDDYLRDCITNGRPQSGMVSWKSQGVKPADIENLIAYVRTFSAGSSAKPVAGKK